MFRRVLHLLATTLFSAILCPEHAKALDGLLKNIGQALRGEPAGSA